MSAVLLELAEPRRCRPQQRRGPLRAHIAVRRIAEERRVEAMVLRRLPRALDGVGRHLPLAIDFAETREREVGRRDERPLLPLRVHGAEEEQLVLQDRSAGLDADVGQLGPGGVHRAVRRGHVREVGLQPGRANVAERRAAQTVRAALGDDVHHAAGGLPVFGFVAAALDLHFFHEVERRAVAERSEHDRVRAERTVALIRDVHAVNDVLILQAAST